MVLTARQLIRCHIACAVHKHIDIPVSARGGLDGQLVGHTYYTKFQCRLPGEQMKLFGVDSAAITSAPSARKASAMARPSPKAAPVTNAAFPTAHNTSPSRYGIGRCARRARAVANFDASNLRFLVDFSAAEVRALSIISRPRHHAAPWRRGAVVQRSNYRRIAFASDVDHRNQQSAASACPPPPMMTSSALRGLASRRNMRGSGGAATRRTAAAGKAVKHDQRSSDARCLRAGPLPTVAQHEPHRPRPTHERLVCVGLTGDVDAVVAAEVESFHRAYGPIFALEAQESGP